MATALRVLPTGLHEVSRESAGKDRHVTSALWIDPTFGASGDMLLGALGGHIEDPGRLMSPLRSLDIGEWSVHWGTATRGGLTATRANVDAQLQDLHRSWTSIDRRLEASELPDRAKAGARKTFRRLGEIEAIQHGVSIDEVHFHEVGAIDAIVDIVGVWLLVDHLAVDEIVVGPVGLGHGTVHAAHGTLPLPAPATTALLNGCPVRSLDVELETCTPTGAALLVSLADRWGHLPSGVMGPTHRGAGGWDPQTHPNVVTATLVDTSSSASTIGQEALIIETNVDDVTPETLGFVIEQLLHLGADDAWVVPIVMKKSRPAHQIRVLCRPELEVDVRHLLSGETGTLGIRVQRITKHALPRSETSVSVDGHEVRIKIGPHGVKPEYDDLVAAARATGAPLRVVRDSAMSRYADQGLYIGSEDPQD